MGIQLRSRWYNGLGREEDDFQGICTTYQSIAANPEVYSAQCLWKDTLVICDEIHHVADDPQGRWGSALRTAFYARTRGIYLSATPFRTDGAPIPFLRYNGEQVCIPNFVYGYRDALADRAIRRVAFAQIEGDLRWLGPHGLHQAIFADPIPSEEDMRRLATALDLRGDWLPAVLAEANERLSQIRHTVQADAGGLVVARDIAHARGIAELLRTITGQEAVVVTSDSRDAEQHISAFDHGRERHRRWIVAVRMISEGVDIRRLYVGVWATDILNSRLFFLQILGRFLRVTRDTPVPWAKQLAWLYIPAVKQEPGCASVRLGRCAVGRTGLSDGALGIARLA